MPAMTFDTHLNEAETSLCWSKATNNYWVARVERIGKFGRYILKDNASICAGFVTLRSDT